MDEPTAALGPAETAQVRDLVKQLKKEGIGIFLISHDLHDVFDLADRVSVIKNGRLVGTARTSEVTKDEVLGMIILGKCPAAATPGPGALETRRGLSAAKQNHPRCGRPAAPPNHRKTPVYLGIDIGTSSVKTVLIDAGQIVLASATIDLTVSRPHSGWSEQTPEDWWQATLATIDMIANSHPKEVAAVAGIGLSGQMHGATLLDAEDRVLRPAILWNDGRSAAECRELEARCPSLRAIAGNIAMPGFTAPKIEWVRKHEPEVYEKIAKVLLPKDYVRLRLSGVYASDMSDSAGTLWLDVAGRRWSDELLEATGLTEAQMPTLAEGTEPTGTLREELRERWGIAGTVVIAGGGGDNAASACGMGTITPGSAFLSLGTSGVLFVSNASFAPNTERRGPCVLPRRAGHLAPKWASSCRPPTASTGWQR